MLLIGVLLAKMEVPLATIGIYESTLFLSGICTFFWVSGILNSTLSAYPNKSEKEKKSFLFNIGIILTILSIITTVAAGAYLFLTKQNMVADESIKFAIIIYILINTPTYFNEYYLLLTEQKNRLITYGVIGFLINVAVVIVPIYLTGKILYSIYGLILFSALKLILFAGIIARNTIHQIDKPQIILFLKSASPLIISILISGSADYIDSWLVVTYFGQEKFAIFRYGAKELPLSLILANSMSTAMIPILSSGRNIKDNFGQLIKESKLLMNWLFPATIILLVSSKLLYPLIFSESFSESSRIFNIYLLLIISRMIFPQSIMMALNAKQEIFHTAILEIIINITASYLLMLKFGIQGIAYGTVIAFFTEKLILAFLLKSKGIDIQEYTPFRLWAGYSTLMVITYILVENFL
jgi:O-antigen/teichoic acid export membrane protein